MDDIRTDRVLAVGGSLGSTGEAETRFINNDDGQWGDFGSGLRLTGVRVERQSAVTTQRFVLVGLVDLALGRFLRG